MLMDQVKLSTLDLNGNLFTTDESVRETLETCWRKNWNKTKTQGKGPSLKDFYVTFSYLTTAQITMWTDFSRSPTVYVYHRYLFMISSSEILGLFQIWSLEVFASMFCFIMWKRVGAFTEHLYSSVFFLNESGFSLAKIGFSVCLCIFSRLR